MAARVSRSNKRREYIKITKDFPLAAAAAFKTLPASVGGASGMAGFNFVLVSGAGATFTPTRTTPLFGRVKGETELALAALRAASPSFLTSTVRPAYVDCSAHEAIRDKYVPKKSVLMAATETVLGPIVRNAFKNNHSPTEPLGRFLTDMAMGKWEADPDKFHGEGVDTLEDKGGFPVVANTGIRRLMAL
jgi:hypothetical protein